MEYLKLLQGYPLNEKKIKSFNKSEKDDDSNADRAKRDCRLSLSLIWQQWRRVMQVVHFSFPFYFLFFVPPTFCVVGRYPKGKEREFSSTAIHKVAAIMEQPKGLRTQPRKSREGIYGRLVEKDPSDSHLSP